jgi:redox-sensitive bicupin YhaK (pirin superfamily)
MSIALVIPARVVDVAGFPVRRPLPARARRHVGPFLFLDHMGPATQRMDVPPHPHIGLATVTYLFEGEIVHRDSLGSLQPIVPGDVNWMVAGRGIAHSERGELGRAHGIQSWIALPLDREETAPSFEHHPARSLPRVERGGARLDVIAGSAFGATSPVEVFTPTLYVHAQLDARARLELDEEEHEERAIYVVSGAVTADGQALGEGTLAIFGPGTSVIEAAAPARAMIFGGAPLDGERHVWWNFVSSSKERIERAKDDWKRGRFKQVVGDEVDFVPLPEH